MRWSTQTTTADLNDVTLEGLNEMIDQIVKRGNEIRNEALEYARCWPSGWRSFGADLYETYGITIAEKIRPLMDDPKFRKAVLVASFNV